MLEHSLPVVPPELEAKDQESAAKRVQLNLESDDSGSASSNEAGDMDENDERSTFEMSDFNMQSRDPVPEGYVRQEQAFPRSNPRLTLVFLAYERPVKNVKSMQTLINVSHIAHKFSSSQIKI